MSLKILLCLMMISLLGFGGGALAQTPAVFCGDLAAEDCALLADSAQVMADLHSTAFHLDMTMTLGDSGGLFFNGINLRLVGDGSYRVDPDILSAATTALSDSAQLPEAMAMILRAISAEASLRLELPSQFLGLLARGAGRIPENLEFEVRMVDGLGYINLDKIALLDPSVSAGWHGLDIAQFYRILLEQQLSGSGAMPFFNFEGTTTMDPNTMSYMSIQRLPDERINGQNAALFETNFDFGAYINDPAMSQMFQDLMGSALRQQGLGTMGIDIDQFLQAYLNLIATIQLRTAQAVGLEDKYVQRMSLNMEWNPDMNELMRAMGVPDDTNSPEMAFNFSFDMTLDLSQFNNIAPIAAPDGANVIPLNGLLPFILPGNLDQA